jgi:CrcB protein
MNPVALAALVGIAGACGAVGRYIIAELTARRWRGRFPLGTFLVNIGGAFALGFLLRAGPSRNQTFDQLRLILGTGFLGGYTTFSTLSYETHALARHGHTRYAWLNGTGTLVAGIIAAFAGFALGTAL